VGSKPSCVIVTRPARDAVQWVKTLTNSGFEALVLPLIEIGPMLGSADNKAFQEAWHCFGDYAACMFVSANAVHYFFRQIRAAGQSNRIKLDITSIAKEPLNGVSSGMRFLAPGPGTAAALLAVGLPAAQIDSPPPDAGQFDSEALWQLVGQRDWQGKRVLVLRGQTSGAASQAAVGREWLAQQLLAAGAHVDMLSVYQRFAPELTDRQIQQAQAGSRNGSVWLFSSSEAVANLTQQPRLAGVDWQLARALATHPRIAQTLRSAGWGGVQESRPILSNIVDALRRDSLA
jgi:uroporphyrinogen-III synthase